MSTCYEKEGDYRPSQVVELERRRVMERPRAMVLPRGRITLRTVVLLSSFITEPRGTCVSELGITPRAPQRAKANLRS